MHIRPGMLFGRHSIIWGCPRTESVQAVSKSAVLVVLSAQDYNDYYLGIFDKGEVQDLKWFNEFPAFQKYDRSELMVLFNKSHTEVYPRGSILPNTTHHGEVSVLMRGECELVLKKGVYGRAAKAALAIAASLESPGDQAKASVSSAVADIDPSSAPHHHDQWDGASISGGADVTNPEIVPELVSQYPFTRHRLKRSKVWALVGPNHCFGSLGLASSHQHHHHHHHFHHGHLGGNHRALGDGESIRTDFGGNTGVNVGPGASQTHDSGLGDEILAGRLTMNDFELKCTMETTVRRIPRSLRLHQY